MTTFAVTNSDQLLPAVNYLLSNLDTTGIGNVTIPGDVLVANTTTGVISQSGNSSVFGYLYQYVNLRYSNNATGTAGFDTNSNNYSYFGVHNSSIPTPSANPTAYQWYEVSPPFNSATSRTLYYSAIGGRQIQWAAASAPPNSGFVITVPNVAIDLDVVTTATGTTGERGPLGMAYVITTADPSSASSSTLTGWFEASRTANTPPIGTGLSPPVVGDTAYFTYPATGQSNTFSYNGSVWISAVGQVVAGNTLVDNTVSGSSLAASTITGNKIAASTITGNLIVANTITGNLIAANTIQANSIQSNSITATQISSSYLYVGNIVSQGATLGNVSSPGYWLSYADGNARFGGNVSIGANLNVQGLITTGALIANTVNTAQVINNAITDVEYDLNSVGNAYVWGPGAVGTTTSWLVPGTANVALADGPIITVNSTATLFGTGSMSVGFQPGDLAPFSDRYIFSLGLSFTDVSSLASYPLLGTSIYGNTAARTAGLAIDGFTTVSVPLSGTVVPAGTYKLVMEVAVTQTSGAQWITSLVDQSQISIVSQEFKR